MASAKEIRVAPISQKDAAAFVKKTHYSGKVDPRSQLHFGVFLRNRLEGAMQFGPSLQKSNIVGLVKDTKWNGFIELNRMAFGPALPKNSESRAIAVAFKIMRKAYPHIEWVISFADATQCGDGAIYRASGFVLTGIKKNTTMWRVSSGEVIADVVTRMKSTGVKSRIGFVTGESWAKFAKRDGAVRLPGFQLRYIYFLNPEARPRLCVKEIPFSRIAEMGAGMYLGKPKRAPEAEASMRPDSIGEIGGSSPTSALHLKDTTSGQEEA